MRRIIAVLAVLAVGLLPACGQQASAEERIAQAPEATSEQGSARMSMKMDMLGMQQDVSVSAEGEIEFESQRANMTMNLGEMNAQIGGDVEMITDAQTIYIKFPNSEQMGLPTPWLKMDLTAIEGMQGMESLSQMNNNDPARAMEMLRGVSGEIEEVGSEDVRGTAATHYKTTLDLDKALEQVPEESRDTVEKQFAALGTKSIPTDVWIDEEGLLRRQKSTIDMSNVEGAGAGAPTEMVIDIEFYDFGTEVNVEPPPADQVTDFAQLQGGGG